MSFTHCYPVTSENIVEVAEKTGVDTTVITFKLFFAVLHESRLFVFVRETGDVAYKMVAVDKLELEEFDLLNFMRTGEL